MTTNAARRSEGVLSASGLLAVLELVAKDRQPRDRVAHVAQAMGIGSKSRAANTLVLLEEMSILATEPDGLACQPQAALVRSSAVAFREAFTRHYCKLISALELGSLFQRDLSDGRLLADSMLLPFRDHGLTLLLLEFGVMQRLNGRAWIVADDLAHIFWSLLRAQNAKVAKHTLMSPARLDAWIANRRAAGLAAEAFALSFEHRRLHGHPLLDQVRWVADEDVSAGYDILSFDDLRSLTLDRHIEVKGHSGDRTFHWSTGEVEAAQKKRQKYWLYLVDRGKVDDFSYIPELYSDPYAYFVEQNPAGWASEPMSFKFSPQVQTQP